MPAVPEVLRKSLRVLPDRAFIKLFYWKTYGRFPNLDDPRTFDEKLQWYKLHYRDPLMTIVADKFEVRQYVQHRGLAYILNEIYGIYDTVEEVDLDGLPDSFVLKATHGSGMNIICRDKKQLEWNKSRKLLGKWLATNYYYDGRQWAYKNIRPRLICERYLENEEFGELIDYKFYCYSDNPEVLFVCTDRFGPEGVKYNAYDMGWNRIYAYKGKPCSELTVDKPDNFIEMVEVARKLCKGFPFVRVDLYSVKGKIFFGELTFYPDNGICPFSPDKYNYFFGDLFVLPDRKVIG